MSGVEYIEIPIETDPDLLAQDAFDYLTSVIPGWVPNDANLETIMVEALSRITANARDVASAVPTSVFRSFGELVNVVPQEATNAFSTVTINVTNNAGYTIPAGTQLGAPVAGDELIPFEVAVDSVVLPGTTTITGVVVSAVDTGGDANGLSGTMTLLDPLDFVTTITLESPTSGGQDAEDNDLFLNRLRLRLQLLAPRPILARDFAVLAQDISGVSRATALDGYNPEHNLLTANQSSLETNTTGWAAGTNCSIARDTTQASDGTANLRLRSVAAGDMNAVTSPTNGFAVLPGEQITAMAEFRAATVARSCRVDLVWYDGTSTLISSTNGTGANDATTGWTARNVTGNAPGNAAYAVIRLYVVGTGAANEDHYADKIAIRHGSYTTNWAIGGTAETGVDRMVAVAAVDEDGIAIPSNVKTDVDNYLESLRELNFIVNVIDPIYTTIDVQTTFKLLPAFTATDVQTNVQTALANYLNPKNWGLPGQSGDASINPDWTNKTVIRYLELTTVVNEVPGVDYVVSLGLRVAGGSYATTDITLGGAVPLPQSGTITPTAT